MKADTTVTFESALAAAKSGALLDAEQMAAIFQIGVSAFYKGVKIGKYEIFTLRPRIGTKRWSGVLVARYLEQQPLYVPTFGRKRAS